MLGGTCKLMNSDCHDGRSNSCSKDARQIDWLGEELDRTFKLVSYMAVFYLAIFHWGRLGQNPHYRYCYRGNVSCFYTLYYR